MNIDERLRNAAADIAASQQGRPLPQLRTRSPFPRWAAAAALVAAITASFVFIGSLDDSPIEPVSSTVPTPPSTLTTPSTVSTPTTRPTTEGSSTTSIPSKPSIAWTEADAARMAEGYLAALAAEQWEIAAFSMENNGIRPDGALADETPKEFLERACRPNLCLGPYEVSADGPGLIDPVTLQAASTVTVTHVSSGETGTIRIATFEGQPIIADLPPLVSGEARPLARALFGDDVPDDLVIARFDAVERWTGESVAWSIQWMVDDFLEVDGDVALVYQPGPGRFVITPIDSPGVGETGPCPSLLGSGVVSYGDCPSDVFGSSGERLGTSGFPPLDGEESGYTSYIERSGVRTAGRGDAEGNLVELTAGPVDLLGEDYASVPRLSPDGRTIAYVDHADDRAESHFWSPIVVVKDTATGSEVARIAFDRPVLWLEFDGRWVVTGGRNADYAGGEPFQETLETFNLETGVGAIVETAVRLWLP